MVAEAARKLAQMAAQNTARPPRLGPSPFGLTLAGAISTWLSLPIVWPSLKKNWPGLNPELRTRLDQLRNRLGPGKNPEFERALATMAVERARRFVDGVTHYRHHPARRNLNDAPIIWRAGTTVLRDYNPGAPEAPAVLAVPSLINRFDILDLDRDHSFLRTLAARGLRPLVVDWDRPGEEESDFSLAEYVNERLIPILDFLGAETGPLNLVGYCMGGSLALALAALRPTAIRTLTLLATPWEFS